MGSPREFHAGELRWYFDFTNNDFTCMWFKGGSRMAAERKFGKCVTLVHMTVTWISVPWPNFKAHKYKYMVL